MTFTSQDFTVTNANSRNQAATNFQFVKDSKTILKRHLIVSLALQIFIVALIALPQLDSYRDQISELTTLPANTLWIPLLVLLLLGNIVILRRIGTHLVAPLRELVSQTKLGTASIAFKKKSVNAEEDDLKHFIESQVLRSADLEQEIARMESEVERITELAQVSPEEFESLRDQLEIANEAAIESATLVARETKRAADLEKQFAELRRELKQSYRDYGTLQEEVNSKSHADHATPVSSILLEKLKTPLSLINNLSWRLAKSWADTPPAQIREGLEEINRQSEEQLELLKKYQTEDDDQIERNA